MPQVKTPKVGFEIEFNKISVKRTAEIIKSLFGGEIFKISKNKIEVKETELGKFVVELDVGLVHKIAEHENKLIPDDIVKLIDDNAEDVAGVIAPREIACPPVAESDIEKIDLLRKKLHQEGAQGTASSVLYAYGVHINPEVEEVSAKYILAHIQSYIELVESFDHETPIDSTRKLSGFISKYPDAYQELVMDKSYNPDLNGLISDYLEYNPTRNRALDMTPLFKHLAPQMVDDVITDSKVKPRPTFHFRLPDCRIGDENWSIFAELDKWLRIRELAKMKMK